MEQLLEQTRGHQKESWNKFSPGWKKWDKLFVDFLRPMDNEIIRIINPKSRNTVLDVASGTGEPGLTIASMLNKGKVIMTSLSEDILAIASENAIQRGIRNIKTRTCDVNDLPFADNAFDGISCRFGFMFFPDIQLAAKEMVRVLKPGRKIVVTVWNVPEKNFWLTATMGVVDKNRTLPTPGEPGLFRCSPDGFMSDLFVQAGLKNISQKEFTGRWECRTADVYWSMMTDIGAPIAPVVRRMNEATREKIKREVNEALNQKYPDGNIMIESSALLISGEK